MMSDSPTPGLTLAAQRSSWWSLLRSETERLQMNLIMKILLCVDGSEAALDAVRHVVLLYQKGLRAKLVLATVQEPTYVHEMLLPSGAEVLSRFTGAASADAMKGAEALLAAAGVPFVREIGTGDPAQALLGAAARHGCAAIVSGARGRGALRIALLGSVSQEILRASLVPVTIV